MRRIGAVLVMSWAICLQVTVAFADRERIEAFLQVTGFDVALESIRLSAGSAPLMLGLEAEDFGDDWSMLADQVFDVGGMHDMAVDILAQTLDDNLLTHAHDFYATDLGQRIVAAENAAHMSDDDAAKQEAGQSIIAGLVQHGSDRVVALQRMVNAADSSDIALRAVQEIQVRFLIAAARAGVVDLRMDEAGLREFFEGREAALRRNMKVKALGSAAYAYQAFSDAEIERYAAALEHPKMQEVYALMNAVQYEVMANRFEALAVRMAELHPRVEL